MNLYDCNLAAIKNTRKTLYNGIMNYMKDSNHNIQITSVPTKDGNNTITLSVDNQQYRLNSIYQPIKEAEKWASTFNFQNIETVISMYGFGNGLVLRELLNRKNIGDKIIVYEPSPEIFLHVLEFYDITDILCNDKVVLTVEGVNEKDFKQELEKSVTWSNVETQIVCMHPQYEKIFLEGVRTFLTIISENNNSTLINRNTVAYFSRDVIENTLKNLRFIKDANTILDLVGVLPQDVPAIIVSAGPSLDKNIELLKQAKGKAVIVATDTAMKFLYAHDIVPDFCVTLDAMKPASYMDDLRFMEVPLFTKVESNWRILEKHTARKIFYNSQEYMNKLFENVGKKISFYTSGGSVATGAFSVCAALRFKTIVLIGQDLAYEGDRTHAGELTDRIRGEEDGVRYVEGIHGGKVKTRHDWYLYLKWFEQAIEHVKSFTTVIDATEGGAKIQNSVIMTLQEVIDLYCIKNVNCNEIITNTPKALTDEEVQKIYQGMQDDIQGFETVNILAYKAKIICEQIIKKISNNAEFNDKLAHKAQKLGQINTSIEQCRVFTLINEYVSELTMHVLRDIYKLSDNEEEDRIKTFKKAKSFYEAIISSVSAIKPMLEDAVCNFWALDDSECNNTKQRVILMMHTKSGKSETNEKVLHKLFGKTILEHNLTRIRQVKQVDDIMIVTSINEDDDNIVDEAQRLGARTIRGNANDLLAGYYYGAKESRADIVVRIALDSPLIDPQVINDLINYYTSNNYCIVSNIGDRRDGIYPKGLEVEVFSSQMLREAYQVSKETYQRQQVTAYLYEKGRTGIYRSYLDYSHNRWSPDTEEGMELINYIYQNLYHGEHDFYFNEILELLKYRKI